MLLLALPASSFARSHHSEAWARQQFANAERMREALNGRPPADRTRHDYQRVLNAYRSVYYGMPTSTKADPSVVAVAETLVEMGRRFDDDKILNQAIAQYRFLRREYPGSKYRCDALFTIGEIYKDDLNDPQQARAVFQEFLHRYPRNRLVDDAQQAVAELDRQAAAERKAGAQKKPVTAAADAAGDKGTAKGTSGNSGADKATDSGSDASGSEGSAGLHTMRSSRLPRVTGIRHWSTPDYTRVAIDLEGDVKFGSQRIADPDRIFFDLRDTKLASTLVGKSFDVDDGFLKKIRVAQFQPGRTRVVLEVDSLSDYDAFLLPNPYRLIIDIHGKDIRGKEAKAEHAKPLRDDLAADVEVGPRAGARPEIKTDPAMAKRGVEAGAKSETKSDAGNDQAADASADPGDDEATASAAGAKTPTTAIAVKTDSTPVKKVIVENDPPRRAGRNSARNGSRSHGVTVPTNAARTKSKDQDAADADDDPDNADASDVPSRGDVDIHEARPTAAGDRSLIRALGLKIGRIVIDPGHGGHDTGTIGPNGLEEKDLVLEVGKRLGKLLETRLGAEVVYTRKDDTFIPLETRTAIANQRRADLFVSIHANSSEDQSARGVETYYLNFTSSPEALEVAARENAVSEKSIYELQDLVKKIALKEKIEESREFAGDVQESLHDGLASKSPGIRDRGVKKAPFIVLIGANMPSILAEISFVSNPGDEKRLETSEYRQKIAESLYRGIAKYVNGLSGVKVASKMDKPAGQ